MYIFMATFIGLIMNSKCQQTLVQNTLNWPISFIKEIASRQARFNHPRIDEGQQVAIDDLEGWAKRIYVGLNK